MTQLNLCYIRTGNGFPELCIQRTKNDEMEVYTLKNEQCGNMLLGLTHYLVRKMDDDKCTDS